MDKRIDNELDGLAGSGFDWRADPDGYGWSFGSGMGSGKAPGSGAGEHEHECGGYGEGGGCGGSEDGKYDAGCGLDYYTHLFTHAHDIREGLVDNFGSGSGSGSGFNRESDKPYDGGYGMGYSGGSGLDPIRDHFASAKSAKDRVLESVVLPKEVWLLWIPESRQFCRCLDGPDDDTYICCFSEEDAILAAQHQQAHYFITCFPILVDMES